VDVEHDRGPFNGLAQITGTITDPTGACIPEATVTVREVSGGRTRAARSNTAGEFSLAGLPPGEYEVRVQAPGFQAGSAKVSLIARDRAVVSASLSVGNAAEMVFVTDGIGVMNEVRMIQTAGIAGGVGGGALGGTMDRK